MYSNIGEKLKIIAVVSAILGVFASIVLTIEQIEFENYIMAVVTLGLGVFLSWLASLGLYSWGEVVSNVKKQTEIQKETLGKNSRVYW